MKNLRNKKIRKLLAFMLSLALMVSCMPSAYTISASEMFGDGTEDIFTDGEVTSETAAEESTPDVSSADQGEQEQAQQTTLTYENDSVKVTAEALEDGALPQNTTLKADTVNENSSVSYDTVSQKLSMAAVNKGSSLRGFFAYDVYFADGDGNRVEPNGRIRVTFEYKTPAAPELTDAANTSVTVEKLHYNSSTGDTDVNTLQANEDLKVLNINENKQVHSVQVETGNAAVFAVMWDSPETAAAPEETNTEATAEDGADLSDEPAPEQEAVETPAADAEATEAPAENPDGDAAEATTENPEADAAETPAADAEVTEAPAETPAEDAEVTEAPAEEPAEDAEVTEAPAEEPAEDAEVTEAPAEDSTEEEPAADDSQENETSMIEVLADETNLRAEPSEEAEVLTTVDAGTQLPLLDTVTAEDETEWYKVSYEESDAYIRSDMAKVVESSDETEEVQPEITRYDYKSDEVNVKVTLTDPADLPDNAELSVTPVELSQEAEDQITEEAIKEKKAIEKIHSYDIKFLVDGEEVQPGNTVKVSVSLNDEKKIKDADVYHVDAEDNVENMDGSVAKNGDVEFETTHFSTYVIVQKGNEKIDVTVKYCDKDGKEIYAADIKELKVGDRLKLKELSNWKATKVVVKPTSGNSSKEYTADDTATETSINLAESATVTAYYEATTGTKEGNPIFFDYTLKVKTRNNSYTSINSSENYTDPDADKKLTSGGYSRENDSAIDNYEQYTYRWTDSNGKKPNQWTGKKGGVVTGLLSEVDGTDVKFNYADPGFFKQSDLSVKDKSNNTVYLRKVYKNYVLDFDRTGDTYTLSNVQVKDSDGNKTEVATAGAGFFPLDSVGYQSSNTNVEDTKSNTADTNDKTAHNYFFGLRYDINFKLGDYIGDLNYKFTGDDDLWVVLDGKKVVIDLGGIHDAADGEVNLWDYLLNKDQKKTDLTEDQKNEEHTLTVLYMERGGGASNCNMNFTLPNATISQVTTDPLGTLTLQKVDSNNQKGLNGARFTLYSDRDCTVKIEDADSATVNGENGKVVFRSKLREGTYYLKETQAPDGYVKSTERWTVEAKKVSDTEVSVTLKDSSGNLVENNQIVNQTQEEIINSSMEYDKTAKVKDWDQRTYDINITAKSTSTSSTVVERDSVADIMMVFDMSGSMNNDGSLSTVGRFDNVKDSLDTTKVYYYNTQRQTASASDNTYYSNPMIYIDGKWQYYNGNTWKEPNNSDVSGWWTSSYGNVSTWNSRITALKEAAIAFIKDTASKSPNSKIGITTFDGYVSGYGYDGSKSYATRGNEIQGITSVGSSPSEMIKGVSKITADGGTSPQKGLEKTSSQLESVKDDGLSKYIILFTDGAPSESSDTTATETSIRTLKQKATIFTVALSNTTEEVPGSKKDNIAWMKELATDEQHAFNASDSSKLGLIFQKIQQTISQNIEITNATITDVIDSRFVIINDNNNTVITNEDLADGKTITLKNGGVVSLNEEGYQVVTWNKQTIPNKAEGKQWSNTITVRAKDEYIGGNNVPTNVAPDSKISTGYGDAPLPQPKVNVKSDLVVNNNETTIFYGDTVPTEDAILKVLFDKTNPQGYVTQLDGKEKLVSYTIGADGQQIKPEDFTLTWYEDEACTKEIKVENMAKVVPDPDSKQYYLKVTYNVGKPSDESNANTTKKLEDDKKITYISGKSDSSGVLKAHNSQKDTTREYGVYTIHIITGQIQIIKKLETAAKEDVEFTFDVKNKDGVKIATATATIKKGDTEGTVTLKLKNGVKEKISEDDTSILTRLARGEYTVTENVNLNPNYTLKNLVAGDAATNCKPEVVLANRQIKFLIGTDKKGTAVLKNGNTDTINGRIGVAEFTNEKSVADVEIVKVDSADTNVTIKGAKFALYAAAANWSKTSETPVKTDIVSGNNGRIELKDLPVGNYLLVETEAATGYSLPTDPWRITVGSGGTVTVMDSKGSVVSNITEKEMTIYQITNTKVYSLPESGGPGIYGFTISGVAILVTALLLFINNKRREEEAKRS